MSVSTNDLKNGMTLELDGTLFQVIEFQHVKPGKGGAFVRTKLRNVKTGAVIEKHVQRGRQGRRWRSWSARPMQFLYARRRRTPCSWTSTRTSRSTCPDASSVTRRGYLAEGAEAQVAMHEGVPIARGPAGVASCSTIAETDPGREGRHPHRAR